MAYETNEGEKKPLKCPAAFCSVQRALINKIDLPPHLDFDLEAFRANLRTVNPGPYARDERADRRGGRRVVRVVACQGVHLGGAEAS